MEAEAERLKKELKRVSEAKTTADAQIGDLIAAAGTITMATEDSTPEDVADKLREARQNIDIWHNESREVWKERYKIMKKEMSRQYKTLSDQVKTISGITGDQQTVSDLAQTLRQAWDKIQNENDDLELALKCLATTVGIGLLPGMKHADIVVNLGQTFGDLQNKLQTHESQRLADRDTIAAKDAEKKDLMNKIEALTTSLEDLQLLMAESKKKKKQRCRKFRWGWRKQSADCTEEAHSDPAKLHDDIVQKNAQISRLEGKLITMADQLKRLEKVEKSAKDQVERHNQDWEELKNEVKLLEFDNSRKEKLIQELRDLVKLLKKNCMKKTRNAEQFRVRDTVNHVTLAAAASVTCKTIDAQDILPFKGRGKPADLSDMQLLGEGDYGKVYLGRHGPDSQPIAIKQPQLPPSYCKDRYREEMLKMKGTALKESMVQQWLSGSYFFPKMLGTVLLDGKFCAVTEFIGNKKTGKTYPLYKSLIRCRPYPKLSLYNMLLVCEDIITGMLELHQKGLLHNDLKDDNVLLEKRNQRWQAVVIDFGWVSTTSYSPQRQYSAYDKEEYRAGRGYYFLAPEVVLDGVRKSVASDIFSLGVILKDIGKQIKVSELTQLASSCMKRDPRERPHSMGEVLDEMVAIAASY